MQETQVPVGISYSGGTSSKWMIYALLNGVLPRPEHVAVFFAETGIEHDWTDEDVIETEYVCTSAGLPFFRCSRPEKLAPHLLSINAEGLTRAEHPPLWVAKDGGGRGQVMHRCTREFKVAPMRRAQAAWLERLGLPKLIEKWIGFAADEVHRAIKAEAKRDVAWERLAFPAVRLGMTREMQRAQLAQWGVHAPRFSMCTICPWKTEGRWAATPAWQRPLVEQVDEAVRDLSRLGITDGEVFLSDTLLPASSLFKKHRPTAEHVERIMDAGCDGGHCFL